MGDDRGGLELMDSSGLVLSLLEGRDGFEAVLDEVEGIDGGMPDVPGFWLRFCIIIDA